MRRLVARSFIIGMAAALSGCVTDNTIDLIAADPAFAQKAAAGAAQAPAYRIGDAFHYKVGTREVTETVERIDNAGVWWRDSSGSQWVGNDRALVPIRGVVKASGKPQLVDTDIQSTGNLFPLSVGKTVSFRTTTPSWLNGQTVQRRSCTVQEYGALTLAAGQFDTYRIRCEYDGHVRFNYYAPALGRVVLQTTDTVLDSVQRELVKFERGTGEPLRTASGPAVMAAKPDSATKPTPARLTTGAGDRFGIQLAAYRSPSRAQKAWTWIKRRGGPLLADMKPHYETAENAGGPLSG